MPRRARINLPGIPLHLIQRGNNRQACFFGEEDYGVYLDWLNAAAILAACRLHSYVLMTNHVHLLISSTSEDGAGRLMKALGQRYVQYVNRRYRRSGTLWEGRYRSCLVQDEVYLLACQRYIELNPVRARMVRHPADYRWSSYRANAQGEAAPLLQPHPLYLALGAEAGVRQAAYRELFRDRLDSVVIDAIRHATNGNYALGNAQFTEKIAAMVGRRVTPGEAGRPRKAVMPGT
jgi:putative transposase